MRASPAQMGRCLSKSKRSTIKRYTHSKHRHKSSVVDASDTTKEEQEETPEQACAKINRTSVPSREVPCRFVDAI